MPAVPLPSHLETQIQSLAEAIRRWRILRGVCSLALLGFALGAMAFALDWAFDLSINTRRGLWCLGVLVSGYAIWKLVVQPAQQPVSRIEIAGILELRYPQLSERLQSLVELSEQAESGNGSRTMIALLAKDTERRTEKLPLEQVVPRRLAVRFLQITGLTVLITLMIFSYSSMLRQQMQRVIWPWRSPASQPQWTILASSGDVVIKRGEPVTISGYLQGIDESTGRKLPTLATVLIRTNADTPTRQLPMTADSRAAYRVTIPTVEDSFEYRLEIDGSFSPWHSVTVVDPVELTPHNRITITAPEYAQPQVAQLTWDRIAEVPILQYSKIDLQMQWNRPALSVQMEWRSAQDNPQSPPESWPVQTDAAGLKFTSEFTVKESGILRIIGYSDKKVRTEIAWPIEVKIDQPPKFLQVLGIPKELVQVRPDQPLSLQLRIQDDYCIRDVYVDYMTANTPPTSYQSERLPILGRGQATIDETVLLSFLQKASPGDSLKFRLRAVDHRLVPEAMLSPQETVYPPESWIQVQITPDAKSIRQQEILASGNTQQETINELGQQVKEASVDVAALRRDVENKPQLQLDHSVRLGQNKERLEAAETLLNQLSQELGADPELAKRIQTLQADTLAKAQERIRQARLAVKPTLRDQALAEADQALEQAYAQVDELRKKAKEKNQDKLDQEILTQLAQAQQNLLNQVENQSVDVLQETQSQLRSRLEELIASSPLLQEGQTQLERAEQDSLQAELKRSAQTIRELDEKLTKLQQSQKGEQLQSIRQRQEALQKRFAEFLEKAKTASVIARSQAKPDPKSIAIPKNPTELKPVDVMTEQEKTAQQLEQLARDLTQAEQARQDPKIALEQLVRWQQDIQRRWQDQITGQSIADTEPFANKLRQEQRELEQSFEELNLPKTPMLEKLRRETREQFQAAEQEFTKFPEAAPDELQKSAAKLQQVADATPDRGTRLRETLPKLEELIREQKQIQQAIESEFRQHPVKNAADVKEQAELAKKLAPQLEKQKNLAKKLSELDLPNLGDRVQKLDQRHREAEADLASGLSQDIPASQQQVLEKLEQLREATQGKSPVDEQAQELARLQEQMTKDLEHLDPSAADSELKRLQRMQEEQKLKLEKLARQMDPSDMEASREAQKQLADELLKPKPDVDELRKKSQRSKETLQQLEARINQESSLQQEVDELSKNRQEEANKRAASRPLNRDQTPEYEARKAVTDDLKQLQRLRVGAAQAEKKQLMEILERLKRSPEPHRENELQKRAVEAANQLRDAVEQDPKNAETQELTTEPLPRQTPDAMPSETLAKQASELAQAQRQLRQDFAQSLQELSQKPSQQMLDTNEEIQQLQESLRQRANKLKNQHEEAASEALRQAENQLEKARREEAGSKSQNAQTSRQAAAQSLQDFAEKMPSLPMDLGRPHLEQSTQARNLREAVQQMQLAEQQLQNGSKDLLPMKKASEALGRGIRSQPNATGNAGPMQNLTDDPKLPKLANPADIPQWSMQKLGENWGQLPGEVRNQVIQQLTEQYGPEYAEIIQRYFQQLANRQD